MPADYSDSEDLMLQAKYGKGKQLIETGSYDEAVEIFTALGDYEDSATMILEAQYQKGLSLIQSKSYDDAIAIFTSLGDYNDSATMISEANYQRAADMLANGQLDDAITGFEALGDITIPPRRPSKPGIRRVPRWPLLRKAPRITWQSCKRCSQSGITRTPKASY
jgi:outer membrane protein assembly factor BamD (BamD/ComL family)